MSDASGTTDAPGPSESDRAGESPPDRPGTAAFLAALGVRRNARRGFGLGVAFAALVFGWFVLVPDRQYGLPLWLALAFVLAVGVGLLATLALTLVSAYRLAGDLE